MPSYTLNNTNNQIDQAISGSYTALFGGGFAGNLRVNGTISGIDGSFSTVTAGDGVFTNGEFSDLFVSSALTVEGPGIYRNPQHFNSGILIGRNAAPNFFEPTLIQSGVSKFTYPVYIAWSTTPGLTISGDMVATGSINARDVTVTGQLLPSHEGVSGRLPIFQSNSGTFGKVNITGTYNSGAYALAVAGDTSFNGSSNSFSDLYSVTVRCNNLESDGLITANLMTIEEIGATSLDSITIVGQTGRFPMCLVIATGNAPTISSSPGTLGQIALKGSKLHVCTGTNAWGTIAIGAFSA